MLDKFESPVDGIAQESGDARMWFAAGDGYIRTSPTDSDDPEDEIIEDEDLDDEDEDDDVFDDEDDLDDDVEDDLDDEEDDLDDEDDISEAKSKTWSILFGFGF